jgi:uncharacterized membrane protein YbhN (UPF0104 family)
MQQSPSWRRRLWPVLKAILVTTIVVMVGRQFHRDLNRPELELIQLRPGWLVLSAGLYLLGLSMSAWFWYRLLARFGPQPPLRTALRAYFIGHLGKYVPGKAWALLMRGNLVRGSGVRLGAAIVSSFYEVLTTMAAGALVAALIFIFLPPDVPYLEWNPVLTGLALLAACGVPLLPAVFNLVVARLSARFRHIDDMGLPRLQLGTLALGLGATSVGWALLGLSTWTLWQGVFPDPPALTAETWARFTAGVALAYVAGFLILVAPSGVGVREYFLLHLLAFSGDRTFVAAAVLLLRLVWTGADVALAGVLLLGTRGERGALAP